MNHVGVRSDGAGNNGLAQTVARFYNYLVFVPGNRMHGKSHARNFGINHLLDNHGHGNFGLS